MKVKLANQAVAAGLIDPVTRRSPFIDPETKAVVDLADVPDNNFWRRRMRDGDVELVEDKTPTGREPIAPLATRGGK